ncbi:MAG: hypothetical protein OCC45_05250 [Desulfotalea sp.]
MSESNQQDALLNSFDTYFTNHDFIKVTKASADNYSVSFKLLGYIKNGDIIELATEHSIHLEIPFGFPLFPPSCKPVSPTFHPDFDPSAICISDFWDPDKTCNHLIEYIGEMIQGIHFSTENSFNDEAAAWYQENSSNFPIPQDNVSSHNNELEKDIDITQNDLDDSDSDINTEDINIDSDIEDNSIDLVLDVDLDMEEDVENQNDKINSDALIALAEIKEFYKLDKKLKEIPFASEFLERDFLQEQTETALNDAESLLKQATSFENKKDYILACGKYQEAKERVSDLYGVDDNISRLNELISNASKQEQTNDTEEENDVPVPKAPNYKKHIPNISIRYLIAFAITILLASGLKGYSAFNDYLSASSLLNKCQISIKNSSYPSAKSSCESVIRIHNNSNPVFSWLSSGTSQEATKILNSEQLQQGLLGKIKINGIWVNKSIDGLSAFQTLQAEADKDIAGGKYSHAKSIIKKARPLAKTKEEKEIVANTLTLVSVKILESKANTILVEKGCIEAKPLLLKAKKEARNLSTELQKNIIEPINSILTECTFKQLLSEGDKLYNSSDWQKALPIYRDALLQLQDTSENKNLSISELESKISKSKLYSAIDKANTAFAQGRWQEAIDTYNKAIVELSKEKNSNKSEISLNKLKRIALQAQIVKNQHEAKLAADKAYYSKAIKIHQETSKIINESEFTKDSYFAKISAKIPQTISKLQSKRFIEIKRQDLLKMHNSLFSKNYPATPAELLSNREVIFLNQAGSLFTYKLFAIDKSSGRPLKLVIFYAYNSKTGKWNFAKPRT